MTRFKRISVIFLLLAFPLQLWDVTPLSWKQISVWAQHKYSRTHEFLVMLKRQQRRQQKASKILSNYKAERFAVGLETKLVNCGIVAPECTRAVSGPGMCTAKIGVLEWVKSATFLRFTNFSSVALKQQNREALSFKSEGFLWKTACANGLRNLIYQYFIHSGTHIRHKKCLKGNFFNWLQQSQEIWDGGTLERVFLRSEDERRFSSQTTSANWSNFRIMLLNLKLP